MANGDKAAAAGMDVVSDVDDRRMGYDEINKTRDYIAENATSWMQMNTTNSEEQLITQRGIGKVTGVAAPSTSEAVVFPVPFLETPHIMISGFGGKATGPFSLTGLGVVRDCLWTVHTQSDAGFTAEILDTNGNLATTVDYYYCWTATGKPAS